ncbi:MAG: family 43 glycosylhydrolase [Lachnospiraceae bacterium]|nr:family 43 glycosylhydrolase [Lachnospiraceae bacterium]
MKKRLLSGILTLSMLAGIVVPMPTTVSAAAEPKEIVLEKSTLGNPLTGFDENGEIIYGGDPNVLVDGDTVYLYVGHDAQNGSGGYSMPNYLCYSTEDLKNWTYEGPVMEMSQVEWATNDSAWAAQVIKYRDRYYMLFCAESKAGGKELGVAVAENPTGPFIPAKESYFRHTVTDTISCEVRIPGTEDTTTAKELYSQYQCRSTSKTGFTWEDIDPTFWLHVDEDGVEHPYLVWGNVNVYMCELEEDLLSVKDQNGDGEITQGVDEDIWYQGFQDLEIVGGVDFTEAPWVYRRQNESGEYFGDYYLFFATHWREEMGYATCPYEKLGNESVWTYGGGIEGYGHLMEPTATSNTNHPAILDFKGKTYFVYHNGSLPAGNGYRRTICIEEFEFNEDGSIDYIQETSTGISGTVSQILADTMETLAHEAFSNQVLEDEFKVDGDVDETLYPAVNVKITANDEAEKADALWEIEPAKHEKTNENYVSIESYNKPGMFLRAVVSGGEDNEVTQVVLSRDHNGNAKSEPDGTTLYSKEMTFRTLKGYEGVGVTFESVAYPGYYMALENDGLVLSKDFNSDEVVFHVGAEENLTSISVQKTTRAYEVGDKINLDDIRIKAGYDNGVYKAKTSGYSTNADTIDMSTPGTKSLKVSYDEKGIVKTQIVPITVYNTPKASEGSTTIQPSTTVSTEIEVDLGEAEPDMPVIDSVHTIGNINYKITKVDEYNTDGINGTVTVTGTTKKKAKTLVIPTEVEIDGYSFAVDKIADKAFYNCKKLKTITIGDNIKSIGKNAFKGIHKKATFKVSSDNYDNVKKLLKKKVGFKKPMKIKEV